MRKQSIEAILFDFDGTIVDTREDIANSVNFTLNRLNRPSHSVDEITSWIGDGVLDLLAKALGGEELLQEALPLFRAHYFENCAEKTVLYPEVLKALTYFSELPLAIVTNKPEAPTLTILEALDINRFFPVMIGGDTLSQKKPSPEPILEAVHRLGVSPKKTIMVGDSVNDIQAGKAAGTATCAVTYGFVDEPVLKSAHPDMLISSLFHLVEHVEASNE